MKLDPLLVNQPYQDPILMIPIPQKSDAILIDLGYCFRLKVRDIQRISKIFITHTHIDHFAGFDHILRMSLDVDKTIEVYGPQGIIRNVEGKLAGYTWNLKENVNLNFHAFEIYPDRILHKKFFGRSGYVNPDPPEIIVHDPDEPVCLHDDFKVYTAFLEHRMPVLGYRVQARPSYNADVQKIKMMGLTPGKWVGNIKKMMQENAPDIPVIIDEKEYSSKLLIEKIIRETPGDSVAYVVDTIFNKKTARELKKMCKNADYLFCECTYLNSEKKLARENYHLTAKQAGVLAKEAGVKTLIPFHFSRRYEGQYSKLLEEAAEVFKNVGNAKKYRD